MRRCLARRVIFDTYLFTWTPTNSTNPNQPKCPLTCGEPAHSPPAVVRTISQYHPPPLPHTPTVCSARTCAPAPDYFSCVFSLRLTALGPPGQNARCTHPSPVAWRRAPASAKYRRPAAHVCTLILPLFLFFESFFVFCVPLYIHLSLNIPRLSRQLFTVRRPRSVRFD